MIGVDVLYYVDAGELLNAILYIVWCTIWLYEYVYVCGCLYLWIYVVGYQISFVEKMTLPGFIQSMDEIQMMQVSWEFFSYGVAW